MAMATTCTAAMHRHTLLLLLLLLLQLVYFCTTQSMASEGATSVLYEQQPNLELAAQSVFASPPALVARPQAVQGHSTALHVHAAAVVINSPNLGTPVMMPPQPESEVRVRLALEFLITDKVVTLTREPDVFAVPVGYEEATFNYTLQRFHDPWPAVHRFCSVLAIENAGCIPMYEYALDRVHMEEVRRGLAGPAVEGQQDRSMREHFEATAQVCVQLTRQASQEQRPPQPTTGCVGLRELASSGTAAVVVTAPGRHNLHVYLTSPLSEHVRLADASVAFDVLAHCMRGLRITSPAPGATLHPSQQANSVALGFEFQQQQQQQQQQQPDTAADSNSARQLWHFDDTESVVVTIRHSANPDDPTVVSQPLRAVVSSQHDRGPASHWTALLHIHGMKPGRVSISLRLERNPPAPHPSPPPPCATSVSFEIASHPVPHLLPPTISPSATPRQLESAGSAPVVVTAVTSKYFEEQRLHNLVGSIHTWQPDARIVVYSLGLQDSVHRELETWLNVEVKVLPLTKLPPHVGDYRGTYAFKACIVDAELKLHPRIVWIDANVELRRPLDELLAITATNGHFVTVQRLGFPNGLRHYPATVEALGCTAPMGSRRQCWTGVVAIQRDSWFHRQVWDRLLQCSLDKDCIAPPGSSRNNHRHDQSVVNSVLCALDVDPCIEGRRWWAGYRDGVAVPSDGHHSKEEEHREEVARPTADELDWNVLRLYNRRDHDAKPYVRHLQRRP